MNDRQGMSPYRAELVRRRLVSIVEEAEAAILRTAYSSTIAEAQDFSAALYDADRRLLAQTRRALGEFIGTLGRGMRTLLQRFPPETLRPGDTIATNDPWLATGHVPDIMTVRPIFFCGRIVAYAANVVHVADLGGKPTADAADTFEEGLHIPPCLLYRQGEPNRDVLAFLAANSRLPAQVVGDIQAQNAANVLMERRVVELLGEYRLTRLREASTLVQARAEEAMRNRVAGLPDGTYRGETYSDGADEPLRVAVAVTIAGTSANIDFAGTSAQVRWGINVPMNLTYAEALYSMRLILGPDIPLLEGSFRPFTVRAPEGCVLNPSYPAPTMVRTVVVHNVCGAIFRALCPLVPEHIPPDRICANFGGIWTFRFRGVYTDVPEAYAFGGPRQLSGSYAESYFFNGGTGALGDRDGNSALSMPVNCGNIPIEIMENRAPVVFLRKELIPDSGGAGRHRGGLGQRVRVRVLSDTPIDLVPGTNDRKDNPPFGIFGGRHGRPGEFAVDGAPVHRRRATPVTKGQVITVATPGGGGCGDPAERSPAAVRRDVEMGDVGEAAARADYGHEVTR